MLLKLNNFVRGNKTSLLLILILTFVIGLAYFGYQQFSASKNSDLAQEVDLSFDPEGPYALLIPRRDGNALILNLKRTASYDSVSYELAYTSKSDESTVASSNKSSSSIQGDDGGSSSGAIDRGVVGNIDTKDKKGEYSQEILFGTCSKNVCKYDQGVENGTLTLHIRKGNQAFRMVTEWRIQKPDIALGVLASGDAHFTYKVSSTREDLFGVGYSIINEVTGVPKLDSSKQILGKVYALNVPTAKSLAAGAVTIELADNPPAGVKIAKYSDSENKWVEMDTKTEGSKLSAMATGSGIFAVLTTKK